MQVELDKQLDEINDSQKEDANKVKGHYIELFDEKASEVMSLRTDLEKINNLVTEYKRKCTDLEYREEQIHQKLKILMQKINLKPHTLKQLFLKRN